MLTEVKPLVQSKKVPGRIGELVDFPLQRVHIELTNVCNFDCTFCPKQEMTRKYEYMEYERVCGIIDQVAEYNLAEKITFHVMGEPFMHPVCDRIYCYKLLFLQAFILLSTGTVVPNNNNK